MAAGQAMVESGCNTPAGAEDSVRKAQAKAAIPEKENHIPAVTGPVTGKAVTGARTGEAIRGETSYIQFFRGFYEKGHTQKTDLSI